VAGGVAGSRSPKWSCGVCSSGPCAACGSTGCTFLEVPRSDDAAASSFLQHGPGHHHHHTSSLTKIAYKAGEGDELWHFLEKDWAREIKPVTILLGWEFLVRVKGFVRVKPDNFFGAPKTLMLNNVGSAWDETEVSSTSGVPTHLQMLGLQASLDPAKIKSWLDGLKKKG